MRLHAVQHIVCLLHGGARCASCVPGSDRSQAQALAQEQNTDRPVINTFPQDKREHSATGTQEMLERTAHTTTVQHPLYMLYCL